MTPVEYLRSFAERAGDGWAVVVAPGGVQEVRHACGLVLHVWSRPGVPLVDGRIAYCGSVMGNVYNSESPSACVAALLGKFDPLRVAVDGARAALVAP